MFTSVLTLTFLVATKDVSHQRGVGLDSRRFQSQSDRGGTPLPRHLVLGQSSQCRGKFVHHNLQYLIIHNHSEQLVQLKCTLGSEILNNPYHLPLLSNRLRRSLPHLVPEVHDEITNAFHTYIQFTEGNSCSHPYVQRYANVKSYLVL